MSNFKHVLTELTKTSGILLDYAFIWKDSFKKLSVDKLAI